MKSYEEEREAFYRTLTFEASGPYMLIAESILRRVDHYIRRVYHYTHFFVCRAQLLLYTLSNSLVTIRTASILDCSIWMAQIRRPFDLF